MRFVFPKIYPILDASYLPATGRAVFLRNLGVSLAQAGATLLEYRNKTGREEDLLADTEILRQAMPPESIKLILDDRIDLIERIGFDGVHVDAGDVTPQQARERLGPERIVGAFGGSENLLAEILKAPADYFSIGPVAPTRTKQTTRAPIGAAGVARLRAQAGTEPVLVAAGGITLENAAAVLEAGASVVAVSEALFARPDPAAEFSRWLAVLERTHENSRRSNLMRFS